MEDDTREALLWPSTMVRESGSAVSLWKKYALFFVNFAIFLLSGAVVGLMIWILVEKEKIVRNAYDFFLDPACVLCLGGSIGFFTSYFGWFGSLREHVLSLKIYRWTLTVLFLLEMVIVVLIFVVVYVPDARQQLNIYPENSLKEAIVKYRDDDDMQNLIDTIQEELECCGTSNDEIGYKDWSRNAYFNCSSGTVNLNFGEYCSVPFSCCRSQDTGLINYMCGKDMARDTTDAAVRTSTIYTRGCFKAISTILQSNVLVVGGIVIGIFVPQIFLTAVTGTLLGQIKIQLAKQQRNKQLERQRQSLATAR